MPKQENIEALQQAVLRFKTRDLEGHLKLYNPSVLHHGFSSRIRPGVAGLKDHYNALLKGFPDMRVDVDDLIADGEKVVHRFRSSGTHKGEFLGAPTGKHVHAAGVHIHLFKGWPGCRSVADPVYVCVPVGDRYCATAARREIVG